MTSRNVEVNIRADTGQYVRSVRNAEHATAGLGTSVGSLKTLAVDAGAAGAAAIAALGAAAVKVGIEAAQAFGKFETTLAQIEGLVGISGDALAGMTGELKLLAVETAQGPQELVEALYFITSAGLEGADAMEALEVSAKASAAGLGEAAVIADLVTSAVNAYGESLGGASVATDVLVATVREGKAEASQLAGSMGRVIPIASQMGISFDQVGAAIAAMTLVGLDADEASTALRNVMTSLLSPTAEAVKALDAMGLSAQGLRDQIKGEGLYATLETLTTAFDGNAEATSAVFGNVRALTGVLSLMGSNAGATKEIFDELATSTGSLDTAYGIVADTGAFAFEQAKSRIEVALLEVGEKILPKLADAVDELAPKIGPLVEALGEIAITMVNLGVTALPAVGSFIQGVSDQLLRGEEAWLNYQKTAQGALTFFDVLAGPRINIDEVWSVAEERQLAFIDQQQELRAAMRGGADAMDLATVAVGRMAREHTLTTDNMETLRVTLGLTEVEWGVFADAMLEAGAGSRLTGADLYGVSEATIAARQAAADYRGELYGAALETDEYASRQDDLNSALDDSVPAFEAVLSPIAEVTNALFAAVEGLDSYANKLLEMSDPAFKAAKAVEAYNKAQEGLTAANKENDTKKIAAAQLALWEATLKAQGSLDAFGFDPNNIEASILSVEGALGTTRDEAIELLNSFGLLDGMEVATVVNVTANVAKSISQALVGYTGLEGLGGRASGGPVSAGVPYKVGEQGMELFVPDRSGTIIPNNVLTQNSTARHVTVDMSGSTFTSNVDVASAVKAGLIAGGVSEAVEWAGSTTIR